MHYVYLHEPLLQDGRMSTDDDDGRMRLRQAEKGTGNTIAMTGAQLLVRKADLLAARAKIFRIVRLPDGQLAPQATTIDEIESLPTEALDRKQYVVHKDWESRIPPKPPQPSDEDPAVAGLAHYASFSAEERAKEVTHIRQTIDSLRKSDEPPMIKAQAIVDAVKDTFLINKASLKMNKSDVTLNERTVANETISFVNSIQGMIEESEVLGSIFEVFKDLSNGQTINHIQRVFYLMNGFMLFFNDLYRKRVGQALRLVFKDCYLDYYRRLFPNLEDIYLTADNMVQLSPFNPVQLKEYALGAYLHDIGKLMNLDYFESDKGFDANEIRNHVFIGSQLVLVNYSTDRNFEHYEALKMTGDHHNALFHKDGYGLTRGDQERKADRLKPRVHSVTSTFAAWEDGAALTFLPTEMLSVIDIYDAMTDSSRTYKKPMNPAEACRFLQDKMVQGGKIDPVVFDIFVDFLRANGQDVPPELGFAWKFANRH
jgi:response regulator RpfG family c-di-GMP phosphodiesterase